MEQVSYIHQQNLDHVFAALANGSRRAILRRLAHGQASVNELAEPLAISQPAVSRHLKVLERAGLIQRDVDEQRRPAILNAKNLAAAQAWLREFEQFWAGSFDQLETLLSAPEINPVKDNNNE